MATINEMIAAAIAECMDDSEGKFAVEVEVDENTTVEASGWYEIDGYREDDYFNGTGRKASDTTQTYYDTEKCCYRCFKKANLVRMA